jgi:uroporphyrinogen-III synthase
MMHVMPKATVVITRSLDQSASLIDLLQQKQFAVLCCPTIKIVPVMPESALLASIVSTKIDAAIFTSTNAVIHTFNWLKQNDVDSFQAKQWFAIGPATQALLAEYTSETVLTGETSNSLGLLAHPLLQATSGQRIFLFTGEEGLDTLETSLLAQGASVTSVKVYRREMADVSEDINELTLLLQSHQTQNLFIFASSVTSLSNLIQQINSDLREDLFGLPVISASERIAEAARRFGFATILIADDANNEAMVCALENIF